MYYPHRLTTRRAIHFLVLFVLTFCFFSCNSSFEKVSEPLACKNLDGHVRQHNEIAFFPIQTQEGWGFIDASGEIAVKPQFKEVDRFSEGLAAFKTWENGLWGYVNSAGEIVIAPTFDKASPFYEEKAVVTVDEGQGVIDKNGIFIVQPLHQKITRFSEGRAFVLVGKAWKIINEHGDYVSQNSFAQINLFSEGLASFAGLNNDFSKNGYINRAGEVAIEFGDDYSVDIERIGFSYGKATVSKATSVISLRFGGPDSSGNLHGLIDKSGKLVVPLKYHAVFVDSPCAARVMTKDLFGIIDTPKKFGVIDLNGKTLIASKFSYLAEFSEGLALAQRRAGEKFGYIDPQGKFVIQPFQEVKVPFDRIEGFPSERNFHSGRALFKGKNGKFGYIDLKGNVVIAPTFDRANRFRGKLAKFENLNEWGYINTEGDVVWQSRSPQENSHILPGNNTN